MADGDDAPTSYTEGVVIIDAYFTAGGAAPLVRAVSTSAADDGDGDGGDGGGEGVGDGDGPVDGTPSSHPAATVGVVSPTVRTSKLSVLRGVCNRSLLMS